MNINEVNDAFLHPCGVSLLNKLIFWHHRKEQLVAYIFMPTTSFGSVHCQSYFTLKINTIAKKLHRSLLSTRPTTL